MRHDVVISPFGAAARDMVDVARCAEDSGFGGVWTYDHMTGSMLDRGRSHDAFALLGAMATATRQVQIGPLVANMMNRHPMQLAVAMATLQSLSSGRAVLGVGAGAAPGSRFAAEHEAIGTELLDGPARRRRLAETISAIRHLWTGGPTFRGEFFTIDEATTSVGNGPIPPIIVGASGPRTVELAAEHADGVNVTAQPRLAELLDLVDRETLDRGFEISIHQPVDFDHPRGGIEEEADGDRVARRVLAVTSPFDLGALARVGAGLHS